MLDRYANRRRLFVPQNDKSILIPIVILNVVKNLLKATEGHVRSLCISKKFFVPQNDK